MILTDLGPEAVFYRAFPPRWAHTPESGAGAAIRGGRFNRPGVEARYLAASTGTALLEYQAESPLLPPATIAAFHVTANNVVDFTRGYDAVRWSEIWSEAYSNWKGMAFLDEIEPPSWVIGDLVREAGHPGILYRSARNADWTCLVLFPELAEQTGFVARVHDPNHDLAGDSSR
ncbi:RES family NAD+ phosphorylase [Luteimonas sp. XNQY3]|nr:RES family NAD+ phosphorylase [Luteimonas sp. XNQY3]MCD9008234.1 RES family NAD+ phosphorylase [Luteimonas sp. XNQY3]